jgi:hypothetical protein
MNEVFACVGENGYRKKYKIISNLRECMTFVIIQLLGVHLYPE